MLPRVADAQVASAQVEVHGHALAREIVRRGGRRVPLRIALADVLPRSYSINLPNAGAWADEPVNWRGHGTLVQVLGEMLAPYPDLVVHVDTDLQLVTVTQRPTRFASQSARVGGEHELVPGVPAVPDAPDAADIPVMGEAPQLSRSRGAIAPAEPSVPPLVRASSGATNNSASGLIAERPRVLAWSSSGAGGVASGEPEPVLESAQRPSSFDPPAVPAGEPTMAPTLAVADESAPAAPVTRTWEITAADKTIKGALSRWAAEAGWQFVWDVPTDYAVDADATIHGTLEQALRQVADALKRSQVPIQVILYGGNKVIRVVGEGAA